MLPFTDPVVKEKLQHGLRNGLAFLDDPVRFVLDPDRGAIDRVHDRRNQVFLQSAEAAPETHMLRDHLPR